MPNTWNGSENTAFVKNTAVKTRMTPTPRPTIGTSILIVVGIC